MGPIDKILTIQTSPFAGPVVVKVACKNPIREIVCLECDPDRMPVISNGVAIMPARFIRS